MNSQQQFADFQSFDDIETARYILIDSLQENEIPYEVGDTKTEGDFFKSRVSWVHPIVVKIPLAYFERANSILEERANEFVTIPEQHYLYAFTDKELLEILQKPDEWSREDYAISKKLLAGRGKELSPEALAKFKADRLNELAKPETVEPVWIYAGFAVALAGGLAAIFFGRIIYSSAKTLPNGKRVYTYDKDSRDKGFVIFVTGIVVLILFLVGGIVRILAGDIYIPPLHWLF